MLASASLLQRYPRLLPFYPILPPSQGRGGRRTSSQSLYLRIPHRHDCPGSHGPILAPEVGRKVTAASGHLHDLHGRYGNHPQTKAPLLVLPLVAPEERRNLDEIPVSAPFLQYHPGLLLLHLIPPPSLGCGGRWSYLKIPRHHDRHRRAGSHGLILAQGIRRDEVTTVIGQGPLHDLPRRYGNCLQMRTPLLVALLMLPEK